MIEPGRKFVQGVKKYRFGFNGKENDNEVKGSGNQQDYGMRIYDPRLGRFLSVDPIANSFSWNSPYSYAENDPINFIDLDGAEKIKNPASPGSVDIAKQLFNVVGNSIAHSKTLLLKATNKSVIQKLKLAIELDKGTYRALMVFIYQNNPTDLERAAYYATKAAPIVKEFLDLTPAGDIKVIVTGNNFKGEEKSRLGAVGWLALDIFGGEILSGLGKASRSVRLVSGPGVDILESVIKKVNNISAALDELHIRAAVNDIFGRPVVINGRTFDHLTEVRNALKGLGNQITELNKVISNSKVAKEVIESATELRNTLQKQKDEINAVLDRATNAIKSK